ncbi:unnamed protein product [Phytophthora fragariaefolia]|uniref:Unnamed protein product n=1 Tax=Phytophthora fragariaefolia TaxID=1490495 RepID=A0A9W7D5V3_9STRA|nr:unnamed protein product [Phytophthora fragariaefolia]
MKVSAGFLVAALAALSVSAESKSSYSLTSGSEDLTEQNLQTTSGSGYSTESSAETSASSLEDWGSTEGSTTQSSAETTSSSLAGWDATSTEGSTTDSSSETSLSSLGGSAMTESSSSYTESSAETSLSGSSLETSSTEASAETSFSGSSLETSSTEASAETSLTGSYPEGTSTESSAETSTTGSSTETESSATGSSTEETTSDGSFTDEQKSIWVERHNYFRMTALPWAAGNMQRMNWDEDLTKGAASAAASCSATTTTGLNVYQSTSTDPSTVMEEAIDDWVVKPVLSNIGMVVPPAKNGDSVGAGMYNSYSQVVWASTTSVGCAMASCSDGTMVACEYSPAGNDGKSAWYVHAAQATECPTGTKPDHGLCIVEGDSANEMIAPIPDGKWTYQVYPTFVADVMATILKAARARDAAGTAPTISMTGGSATSAGSEMYQSLPASSEESSSDTEQTTSSSELETSTSGYTTDSSEETSYSSLGSGSDVPSTEGSATDSSADLSLSSLDGYASGSYASSESSMSSTDSFAETSSSSVAMARALRPRVLRAR